MGLKRGRPHAAAGSSVRVSNRLFPRPCTQRNLRPTTPRWTRLGCTREFWSISHSSVSLTAPLPPSAFPPVSLNGSPVIRSLPANWLTCFTDGNMKNTWPNLWLTDGLSTVCLSVVRLKRSYFSALGSTQSTLLYSSSRFLPRHSRVGQCGSLREPTATCKKSPFV